MRRGPSTSEGCWAGSTILLLTILILWELNFHIGLKARCPLCDPDQGLHGLNRLPVTAVPSTDEETESRLPDGPAFTIHISLHLPDFPTSPQEH